MYLSGPASTAEASFDNDGDWAGIQYRVADPRSIAKKIMIFIVYDIAEINSSLTEAVTLNDRCHRYGTLLASSLETIRGKDELNVFVVFCLG